MRRKFFVDLYELMKENKKIIALTGDLGYGGFDRIIEDFPDRYINCGAAEQSMLDIAVGIAQSNKIPIVYSITPFLLYRGFETIRNYLSHEETPVILIGAGRDRDYERLGFSHWAEEDHKVMSTLPNIECCWPDDKDRIRGILENMIINKKPGYINLER